MVQKTKLIGLPEAEDLARAATRDALAQHPQLPWKDDARLTLGTFFPDRVRDQFSLYLAAEKPSDGTLLTTSTVDSASGEVVVTLHEEAWAQSI